MREKSTGKETLPLAALGESVIAESLERGLELLTVNLLGAGKHGLIWVLRGGVDVVDELRLVLVGRHVSLVLVVLVLRTVEVAGEGAVLRGQ